MESYDFPQGYFGTNIGDRSKEQQQHSVSNLANYKKRYLVRFIKSLPQNAVVLDSGCGKGKTIRLINHLRPDITVKAHDVTDVSSLLPSGIEFKKCTTEELGNEYAAGSFDAIFSEHVLEHLVYPTQAIENFIKVLKPGGRVFIETPNWTRLFLPFSRIYFWNDYTHIHPFCKRAFERLFSEYGMEAEKIVTVSSVDYPSLFRSFWAGATKSSNDSQEDSGKKVKTKIKKTKFRRYFDWCVEFFINPFAKDILIGIARK